MDLIIFGLAAAGLHIAIDIVLLSVYAVRHRKNKEDKNERNSNIRKRH